MASYNTVRFPRCEFQQAFRLEILARKSLLHLLHQWHEAVGVESGTVVRLTLEFIWVTIVGAQGSRDLAVFSEPPHQRSCLTMSYENLFRLSFVNSL